GSSLQAQQPLVNAVRTTLQALAAVLGGCQSLHTNGYDEALSLPTEQAATLALRTQQVIAHESGVARTADPLAGSWFVEHLTDEVEARAREYLERIADLGGAAKAIDYMQEEIHRAAYRVQLEVEEGERTVVGVNAYQEAEEQVRIGQPDFSALEVRQKAKLADLRERRDTEAVEAARARIRRAADAGDNLLPPIVDAVKALATLGEISDTLRDAWGTYDGHAS
ncbi:MAG: methylmalonyl-CoA mutase, partial [Gemmatimonadetes bacterium]|nr:methylmalonyl-CoA mutase [Gemmatimonadota bacterium]